MKVQIYKSCKGHFKVYAEIYGSIAVNSVQIELSKKDKIVLDDDIDKILKIISIKYL